MVQEFQAFKRQEGADFLDRFGLLGDDRREPSGGDDGRCPSEFSLHASDDTVHQPNIAEQQTALNAADRIGADDGLGRMISTFGSLAVRENRASAEIPRPGAMTPPRYSADLVTAQKVVAVPKSTIMRSDRYRA